MLGNGHVVLDEGDLCAVAAALEGRDFGGGSGHVVAYEAELARFFGVAHAVACASGTVAITLALQALEMSAEAEVMLPATSPAMTALGVIAAGATPVFIDVDRDVPFAPDLRDATRCLDARSAVILTVPMWGYAGGEPAVGEFARKYGLVHIEDAAQAHGSTLAGDFVGTLGTIGTFSTHTRKLMTTGEGGFCLTADERLARRLRSLRTFGVGPGGYAELAGSNAKLAGVLAALGESQLRKLGQRVERRRERWYAWKRALSGIAEIEVMEPPGGAELNGYALVARVAWRELRDALERALAQEGVESDPGRYSYAPAYHRPALRSFARACPKAEELCASVFTVPTHEAVSDELIGQASGRLRELCAAISAA